MGNPKYLSARADGDLDYLSTDQNAASPDPQTYADLVDAAAPGNPAAGVHRLYSKADGMYYRDSAGVEKGPLGAGGASGGAFPPFFDISATFRPLVTGSGNVTSPEAATDGNNTTYSNAQTAAVPQTAEFDLGPQPPEVGSVHVIYGSGNYSATGTLDWSDDAAAWTTAATWTGLATLDRNHIVSPALTHRYWRIRTTATNNPGVSGVLLYLVGFRGKGIDRARGVVPTTNQAPTNTGFSTDDFYATSIHSTQYVGYPAYYNYDLGAAYAIGALHVRFPSTGNAAVGGRVMSSTDGSTWTERVAWANTYRLDHYYTLTPAITARYWRLEASSIPGNSGLDVSAFEVVDLT